MNLLINNEKKVDVNLIELTGQHIIVEVEDKQSKYFYSIGSDQEMKLKCEKTKQTFIIYSNSQNSEVEVFNQGNYFKIHALGNATISNADDSVTQLEYVSPMPGKISKINVKLGQKVVKGEVLLYLEAMKMEHPIKAKMDAYVEEVLVTVAQQVDQSQLLIKLKKS